MAKRLTRAESQERTRGALVEAATKLFLRDGFKATSLDQVAEEAGYTRGAVHSNFESKAELGAAVLDDMYRKAADSAAETLRASGLDDLGKVVATLSQWVQIAIGAPQWIRLEMEVAGASAYNDETKAATAKRVGYMREMASAVFAEAAEKSGSQLLLTPDETALVVLSIALGLGFQTAADSSISAEVLQTAISRALGLPSPVG
ncbi:TetR/AcrR family transcriptional regulator [Smaragdicoccus niigatensis]|uniref:TetR/AcrR family transcriptional regulator n=1 Tax=Smaragdicoccus niigatensis TaxID=359359 RepID=UPI000377F95C|nr:TetR/AcrR family transcriptional regulator [Smaragdicoccus niigatensis]